MYQTIILPLVLVSCLLALPNCSQHMWLSSLMIVVLPLNTSIHSRRRNNLAEKSGREKPVSSCLYYYCPLPSIEMPATSKNKRPNHPIPNSQEPNQTQLKAYLRVPGCCQSDRKEDGAGNAVRDATAPHVRAAKQVPTLLVIAAEERCGIRVDKVLVPGLGIVDAGNATVVGFDRHYHSWRPSSGREAQWPMVADWELDSRSAP